MTFLCKLKFLVVAFTIFYSVYLTTYKCPKVHESVLDHAVQKAVHPFSHQHDQLCSGIEKAESYVSPYYAKVHHFLDAKVHSHHLFKQYKVESKFAAVRAHYYANVHAFVLKFWSLVELAEYHVAVQSNKLYKYLEAHFHKTVVPKVAELKSTVAAQAETVAEQVKSKMQ